MPVRSSWMPIAFLVTVFFACAGLYGLGAGGPFLLDDFHNLEPIAANGGVTDRGNALGYIFGREGTDFSRSVARASFLINDQFWPSPALGFKWTNIALHLVIGLVLALLLLRLLPKRLPASVAQGVALLAVALWLLHPLQVSTTLYVVQRMTQLMTLFSLLAILSYVAFRHAQFLWKRVAFLAITGLFALLALFSKENAVVLLLLIPLVEWTFFREPGKKDLFGRWCAYLALALSLLFVLVFFLGALITVDGYAGRNFTMLERLLVQGQVLWQYVIFWFYPNTLPMSLYHDDVEWLLVHRGLGVAPLYWLVHAGFMGLAGYLLVRARMQLLGFGLLWFYVAHIIESSVIPLELMFEHRNYLPSIGLALICAQAVVWLGERLRQAGAPIGRVAIVVLPVMLCAILLAQRAVLWGDYRALVSKWAAEHPYSFRAQQSFVAMLAQNGLELMAYQTAKENLVYFDDLSLRLFVIHMACALGEESDVTVELARLSSTPFSSGLLSQMRLLSQVESDSVRACIDAGVLGGSLEDVYDAIADMPLLQGRPNYYAVYLENLAKHYILQRDYTNALLAKEKMWQVQPTVDTALALTDLLIAGGNITEAVEMNRWATERNAARWFRIPTVDSNLLNQKRFIELLQAQNHDPDQLLDHSASEE